MIPDQSCINDTVKAVKKTGRAYAYFREMMEAVIRLLLLEGYIAISHEKWFDSSRKVNKENDYYEIVLVNEGRKR